MLMSALRKKHNNRKLKGWDWDRRNYFRLGGLRRPPAEFKMQGLRLTRSGRKMQRT